jgi:polyhydroxyalkanoate synthesis regulator phasin
MKINGVKMNELTIQRYAIKHKLSVFNVMKMVKSGKLKSFIKEEKGKEVTCIMLDDETEQEVKEGIHPFLDNVKGSHQSCKSEIEALKSELSILRKEIEDIKNRLSSK